MMTSISIAKEKELGTMEILLVSPLNPLQIIVGKVVPYFFISLINYIIIIILAKYVFLVPITGSIFLLILESVLFLLTSLSLGILISTISNNQQTALMISISALMLPAIILSGYIFPVENMPLPLQVISNIIPAKWFIIIVRGIMLKGVSFSYIVTETAVLAGMTLFFVLLSIKKFKIRLE
jgi:ABC-2 type transport system permease protein